MRRWQKQIVKTVLPYVGITVLLVILCWIDYRLYLGVLQLDWISVPYVLAIACIRGAQATKKQHDKPKAKHFIIVCVLTLSLISMPLGFWMFCPTFTTEQAREKLVQNEIIQVHFSEKAYATMPSESPLGKFIQSGYLFPAIKTDGRQATIFFDPVSGSWSWLVE